MDWNVVLQYFKNISMLIILSSNAKFLFSTKYIEAVSFLKCWSFILGFFFSVSILNKAVAVLQWLNTPWQNLLCKMYTKVSHLMHLKGSTSGKVTDTTKNSDISIKKYCLIKSLFRIFKSGMIFSKWVSDILIWK